MKAKAAELEHFSSEPSSQARQLLMDPSLQSQRLERTCEAMVLQAS